MHYIENLNTLVAQGKIDEVLKKLQMLFKGSTKLNEVILHSSRYTDLKDQIRLGLLDYQTSEISKNKITLAILELIGELNEAVEKDATMMAEFPGNDHAPKIIQNHSGSGDNVAGDKIINS